VGGCFYYLDTLANMDNIPNDDAELSSQAQQLLKLASYRMPFGKYKGQLLIDLPEPYVVWFSKQGFPNGELGIMLGMLYEIKLNGLEYLFKPFRK
jgi:uncharacterized protein (DUF3820 family)